MHISEALGREKDAYRASSIEGDRLRLHNPEQDLSAEIASDGVTFRHGGERWHLALRRWGRGSDMTSPRPGRVVPRGNRVEIERGPLTEWYVNGPLGLEQGFTVWERPSSTDGGRLVLEQTSRGAAGSTQLDFGGLFAFDAGGRELPVEIGTSGARVEIRVDDREARYPIVVDPFVQLAKLVPKKPEGGDFAVSMAISGDTIAVGAPFTTIAGEVNQGAVYVFVRSAIGWTSMKETARLTSSDVGQTFLLGLSVAIDGDTVVASSGHPVPGGVYVWVRPAGGWESMTETARLTPSDPGMFDEDFGNSVAIDGDTIVVGRPLNSSDQGAAYVYVKPLSGWATATETAKLTAAAPANNDRLGNSVAIDGDTIVAGAPFAFLGTNTGKAFVFIRPLSGWVSGTEDATLSPSAGGVDDGFGTAVDIDGDTVVIGAPRHDVVPDANIGAAYVFVRPGGTWLSATETAKLVPTSADAGSAVGTSVAVVGNRVVAGAHRHEDQRGAAFVFDEPGGGWAPVAETGVLRAADRTPAAVAVFGDQLGVTVDLEPGGAIIAGANLNSLPRYPHAGTGYVFENIPSALVCPPTPAGSCASSAKGTLEIKYDSTKVNGDKIKWKFSQGPELHQPDFGDPLTSTSYALCVYDDGALALSAGIIPGFTRWSPKPDAYKYFDRNRVAFIDGVSMAGLKGGAAGKSSLSLSGKGEEVGTAPLTEVPFSTTILNATTLVQAQLHQTGGDCYDTSFTPAQVLENEFADGAGSFKARY
jgi:hypothetical protein